MAIDLFVRFWYTKKMFSKSDWFFRRNEDIVWYYVRSQQYGTLTISDQTLSKQLQKVHKFTMIKGKYYHL